MAVDMADAFLTAYGGHSPPEGGLPPEIGPVLEPSELRRWKAGHELAKLRRGTNLHPGQ